MSTTEPTPATKLVLFEGHEFEVEATASDQEILDTLAREFPGVRGAEVRHGTRTRDGRTYATVEFVKRVGTKGSAGEPDLVAALRPVPAVDWRPTPAQCLHRRTFLALTGGELTFDQAMMLDWPAVVQAQRLAIPGGAELCARMTQLTPVAGTGPVVGWSR